MNGWKDLPNEILDQVFRRLGTKDNVACSLTCRHWKSAAQSVLFESITSMGDEKMESLSNALSFYQNDSYGAGVSESPGGFVKTLDCRELSENFDVETLDTVFPHLEVIEIEGNQFYLSQELCRSIMKGNFPNLKQIPNVDKFEFYLKLALKRREHINELHLQDGSRVDSEMCTILQDLLIFPKLKVLEVFCRGINTVVYLENIFSRNRPTISTIDSLFPDRSKLILHEPTLNMNNAEPLSNVRNLRIVSYNNGLFNGGDASLMYFMQKFQALENLEIVGDAYSIIHSNNNIVVPTTSHLCQFLLYLFNMRKKSAVGPLITDQFTTEIIQRFFQLVLQTSTYKYVKLHLKVLLEAITPEEEEVYPENRTAYIMAENRYSDHKRLCEIQVVYKTILGNMHEPHLELFQKIGKTKIKCLTVGDHHTIFALRITVPIILNDIFDNFTNLKELRLCHINQIVMNDIETNIENKLQSFLESLQFFGSNITQDLFPKINQKCVNLKSLVMSDCQFNTNPGGHIFSINMQYVSLKNLHLRITSASDRFHDQYKWIFIKLQTDTKKPRYCKVYTKGDIKNDFAYNYTEADYESSLVDQDCLVLDVFLEAVTRFAVETDLVNDNFEHKKQTYIEEDYH